MTEIFNEYYKLKSEYDETERERIQKIRNNRKLSKLEKRIRFKKSKPQCIKCKQKGGMIFTTKFNEQELFREMTARCGNLEAPCDLYLFVQCGSYLLLDTSIRMFEQDIEVIKRQIVVLKNKILFGYIPETGDDFDVLKTKLNSVTSVLETNIRDIFADDTELNTLLELNTKLTDTIKALVNDEDIDDAVSIYIDQLLTNLKQLRETKYKQNIVLQTDETSFQLAQLPTTIASLEQELEEPFLTRARIIERNDEPKQIVSLPKVKFELTETGVVFDNETHQEIFNSLSDEYQMELIVDDDWLIETITEYAKSGQPYTFVPPSKLKFPPTLKPDGTYTFGYTIYNEEFAKLPNKDTTLSRNDLKTYMDTLVGKRLLKN